jgi:hypothetical protein
MVEVNVFTELEVVEVMLSPTASDVEILLTE